MRWIGKPYREIYDYALKAIGRPDRALCIGDSAEHDVGGGRSAGLTYIARENRGVRRSQSVRSRARLSYGTFHLAMSHSCSFALWNFQVRFGPAITLR